MIRRPAQAGFTLVELLVSLVLLTLALTLAAQMLEEAAQTFADAAAETRELPTPLVLARLRADVRAASSYEILEGGSSPTLRLAGHPAGTIFWESVEGKLHRTVLPLGEPPVASPLLDGVESFRCLPLATRLLGLEITVRKRSPRRTPLPQLPGLRPPPRVRTESLLVALRGAGLGASW